MDEYVIKLHSLGRQPLNSFLKWFDHEAHAPDSLYPTGYGDDTVWVDEALTFNSFDEALKFMMKQPKCCPLRPDGYPNRPLMAFTFEIITKKQVQKQVVNNIKNKIRRN